MYWTKLDREAFWASSMVSRCGDTFMGGKQAIFGTHKVSVQPIEDYLVISHSDRDVIKEIEDHFWELPAWGTM